MSKNNKYSLDPEENDLQSTIGYKSKKENQKIPENINMDELMGSTFAQNMMAQRGLSFEQGGSSKAQVDKKPNKITHKDSIIPGQAMASFKELIEELEIAEKKGNIQLAINLLETIIDKDISDEEKLSFNCKRIELMYQTKRYEHCQEVIERVFRDEPELPNNLLLKLLIVMSKCSLELGQIWRGFGDYLRVRGIVHAINNELTFDQKFSAMDKDDLKAWNESEQDKDLRAAEELGLLYQVRFGNEKKFTETVYVTAMNFKNSILGLGPKGIDSIKETSKILPELRNRKILQLSCGEHHTLALVEGDLFDLWRIQDPKTRQTGTFGCREIIGWGENTCGQVMGYESQENVCQPTVIRHFIGKDIGGIHAARASSICFDSSGNVYEWGYSPVSKQNMPLKKTYTNQKGVTACRLGASFSCLLTKDNLVLIKGKIEGIVDSTEYKMVPNTQQIKQIEAGNNHIIALTSQSKVLTLGSNKFGQLGIGSMKANSLKFYEANVPDYIQKPKKVFAFKEASALTSGDDELFIWGGIYDSRTQENKTISEPFQYEIDNGNPIRCVDSNGSQLYVIDHEGTTYCWDLQNSSKFKPYRNTQEFSFQSLSVGKTFQVLQKGFVNPSFCYLHEPESEYTSLERAQIGIRLANEDGDFHQKLYHPCRYYIYFSDFEDSVENVKGKVLNESKMMADTKSNKLVTFLNNFDCPVLDVQVAPSNGDNSIHNLNFMFEKDGNYFLYVFINEEAIKGLPFPIKVGKSKDQEKKEADDEAKRRKKEEERKTREEAALKKKIEEQRLAEEKEKKQDDVLKRAEEKLAAYQQQQKAEQERLEQERKMKRDLLTGGGFDLEKASLQKELLQYREETKKNDPAPTQAKKPSSSNSSSGVGAKKITKAPSKDYSTKSGTSSAKSTITSQRSGTGSTSTSTRKKY